MGSAFFKVKLYLTDDFDVVRQIVLWVQMIIMRLYYGNHIK